MTVLKTSEIAATERGGGLFKGRVTVQSILDPDSSDLRTTLINFDEGTVNGSFVVIPAGERHWHGATPDSAFPHIAISIRGNRPL